MSTPFTYRLSIEAILPKVIEEGKVFKVTYRVRNISESTFPGGQIFVVLSWLTTSLFVTHPISIRQLQPNEPFEFSYDEKPATSGLTIVTHPGATFKANNEVPIELYLPDGRKLIGGQVIGGVRARSPEEVSEARAVWVAAGSLVVLIVFQIVDWLIRFYWHF